MWQTHRTVGLWTVSVFVHDFKTLLNRSHFTWSCLWLTLRAIKPKKSSSPGAPLTSPTPRRSHPCHHLSMSTTLWPLVWKSCSEWRWSIRHPTHPLPPANPQNPFKAVHSAHTATFLPRGGISRSERSLIFGRAASHCLRSTDASLNPCHWIDSPYFPMWDTGIIIMLLHFQPPWLQTFGWNWEESYIFVR